MFAGLPPSSSDLSGPKSVVPPSPPADRPPLGLVLAALAQFVGRSAARTSLVDETERPNRVTLLAELGHTGVDLAAGKVINLQPRHDLVCAAGYCACE